MQPTLRLIGDNILASETIAIAMPTVALIPSTIYATYVYSQPNITYTECGGRNGITPYRPDARIGHVQIYEPFSTATNLAYVMAGLGIYLYCIPNKAFVHMQMYAVGLLFIILGTGSGAMHADGSRLGTWEHAADVFSIYALFVGLAGVSFLGVYHAIKGKAQIPTSRDPIPSILTAGTLLGIGACIFMWKSINQAALLVSSGAVIIISNATTQGIFAFRSARFSGNNTMCSFISAFLVSAVPRVIVLTCALYINLIGRKYPGYLQKTCANANNTEYRIEVLKRWDWIHGIWHYLSATALTGMALSSQQGLDGVAIERLGIENTRMPCVRWIVPFAVRTDEYVEELISRLIVSCYSIACVVLFESEASSRSWEIFTIITSLTILPIWSVYSYYSISKARNTLMLT